MTGPTTLHRGGSEACWAPAAAMRCCAGLVLSAAAAGAALAAGATADSLRVRIVNDQAAVLQLVSAPARQTPAFSLERRCAAAEEWVKVQPLETSFCPNPCPASGELPIELDCGRPPHAQISVAAGGEVTMTWSGQVVEEVARRHPSGKTRTCTQVQPAPPGIYRLSLCARRAAGETLRCTSATFSWPRAASSAASPQVLRWSDAAILPAR